MKIIIEKYMQLRHQYHALTVNDVLKIYKAAFLSRESHQCRLLSEDSNHVCFNCKVIIPDLKEYLSNHFFTLEKVLDVLGSISFLADEKQMFRKILKNHERKPHKLKFMSVFFQYRIICELIREDRYDLNTPNATLINFRNKIRDTFNFSNVRFEDLFELFYKSSLGHRAKERFSIEHFSVHDYWNDIWNYFEGESLYFKHKKEIINKIDIFLYENL